jgi:hypothetical protein
MAARSTTRPKTADDTEPEQVALPEAETDEAEPQVGGDQEQFPSKHGEPETEVAHRSADGSSGMKYRKTFVLLGVFPEGHPAHEDNARHTLEEAIQRGLHPKGEAVLVDTKEVPEVRDLVSSELTYEVEVVPAVVDDDAPGTVTPRKVLLKDEDTTEPAAKSEA